MTTTMRANRRAIEDRADEAQANLAELRGIEADVACAMRRTKRLLDRTDFPHPAYGNAEEAYQRLEQAIDEIKAAINHTEDSAPDLDTTYPGRRAPGSH